MKRSLDRAAASAGVMDIDGDDEGGYEESDTFASEQGKWQPAKHVALR